MSLFVLLLHDVANAWDGVLHRASHHALVLMLAHIPQPLNTHGSKQRERKGYSIRVAMRKSLAPPLYMYMCHARHVNRNGLCVLIMLFERTQRAYQACIHTRKAKLALVCASVCNCIELLAVCVHTRLCKCVIGTRITCDRIRQYVSAALLFSIHGVPLNVERVGWRGMHIVPMQVRHAVQLMHHIGRRDAAAAANRDNQRQENHRQEKQINTSQQQ